METIVLCIEKDCLLQCDWEAIVQMLLSFKGGMIVCPSFATDLIDIRDSLKRTLTTHLNEHQRSLREGHISEYDGSADFHLCLTDDTLGHAAVEAMAKTGSRILDWIGSLPGIFTYPGKAEARLIKLMPFHIFQTLMEATPGPDQLTKDDVDHLKSCVIQLRGVRDPANVGTTIVPSVHGQEEIHSAFAIRVLPDLSVLRFQVAHTSQWRNPFLQMLMFDLAPMGMTFSGDTLSMIVRSQSLENKEINQGQRMDGYAAVIVYGNYMDMHASHVEGLLSQEIFNLKDENSVTLVTRKDQVEELVDRCHRAMFEETPMDSRILGPSWESLQVEKVQVEKQAEPIRRRWWADKKDQIIQLANQNQEALYLYNKQTLQEAVDVLKSMKSVDRIFFAIKANPFPGILRVFYENSLGFECVSPGEIDHIFRNFPDISPDRILFTPNFAPKSEYVDALKLGVHVTIDNIYILENWPEIFKNKKVVLRIDPGKGEGHHHFVKTGGKHSKFGIEIPDLSRVSEIVKLNDIQVEGLHCHLGSGIYTTAAWRDTAKILSEISEKFPQVEFLDLGGGLGVSEKENSAKPPLDLKLVDQLLLDFKLNSTRKLKIFIEPGRYLVALAGILVTSVAQIKLKSGITFLGLNTGFNSLIRPMLYHSYHELFNLTHLDEPQKIWAEIVGNICESGDVFGHNRGLPETSEGDVIVITVAGAYGHSMSSHYNIRNPAKEILLE